MGRPIKRGSTDQSVVIHIMDSTDGSNETGVVYNTSGIDLWYRRQGSTKTSITEATLAATDSAHSDGGIIHIGDGDYRLDLPDAAVASSAGINEVTVGGTVTGMIVVSDTFPLVAYDPYDAVRIGITALPNAAADAAGGLPISDAGGLDLDAKLANTNEITAARMGALTDWINGGRLDLIIDDILTDTGTTLDTKINTIDDFLDTEIAAIKTKTDYLPSATAGAAGGLFIAGSNAATSITTALTANIIGNITGNLSGSVGSLTGHTVQTGDSYARLGAPAGASISADIAAVKTQTAAIEVDTQDLQTQVGTDGAGLTNMPWNAAWDAEVQSEVFDALDSAFTDATSLTANGLLDRIRTLMWVQRNKITVTDANGNTVIYKDDNSTQAFAVNAMLTDDSTSTVRLRAA
jgi:hypothetical protein